MSNTAELIILAGQFLNEKGQQDVRDHLADGKEKEAQEYLLGAIDKSFELEGISYDEAAKHYRTLNVPPERASRLRQLHKTN